MLEPLSEKETTESFTVLDIENREDGRLLSICMAWRDDNGNKTHRFFWKWGDWLEFILRESRKHKRFRTIWAHNGGGWDWLSLAEFILKESPDSVSGLFGCRASSKLVTLVLQIDKRHSIRLCDSYRVLVGSLNDIGKKLAGRGKIEIDELPHIIWEKNPKLFEEYAIEDCYLLLDCLEKALELIRRNLAQIGELGVTAGATALKVWRTGFQSQVLSVPIDETVKAFLRAGYSGGRVEVFRYGKHDNVTVYDINSLYPSVMRAIKVPYSYRGQWIDRFSPGYTGAFLVKFEQMRKDIPPVLMIKGKSAYSGEGIFYSPELAYLREVDKRARIHCVKGYIFHDNAILFRKFVDECYQLRLTDPTGPLGYLCKLMMNSLYGKWAQKSVREQLVKFRSKMEVYDLIPEEGLSGLTAIDEENLIYYHAKKSDCRFEHVAIAGLITSAARVALHKGLVLAGKDLIYCDTDSVHTTGKLPDSLVGTELGKFKLEAKGEAVYCGRKLYAIRLDSGREKVRAKGVSVGGKLGCKLSFDDMVAIANGKRIECRFITSTSALEVFSGKPLRMGGINNSPNRKRTIGKT